MSLHGYPVQHIQSGVRSLKHEHLFEDYHANAAPHEVVSVDEKVQLHLVDGMAMAKKLLAEMVELATVITKVLTLLLVHTLDLATP